MEESETFLINHILSDNNARLLTFGPNSYLNMGNEIAVKTGTTNDKRDNWTVGWNRRGIVGVWVGNNDNSPMNPTLASGISGAAPIWNKIMNNLLAKQNPSEEKYTPPKNIVIKPCGGKNEYFIKGTENRVLCRPISLVEQKPNP